MGRKEILQATRTKYRKGWEGEADELEEARESQETGACGAGKAFSLTVDPKPALPLTDRFP